MSAELLHVARDPRQIGSIGLHAPLLITGGRGRRRAARAAVVPGVPPEKAQTAAPRGKCA